MTLLQKIQNLTWWTLDIKLKEILTILSTSSEDINERVSIIESNPPTNNEQDLQSVLSEGSYADIDEGESWVDILSGSTHSRKFNVGLYSGSGGNDSTEFYIDPFNVNFYNSGTVKEGGMNIDSGEFYLYSKNKTLNESTSLYFTTPTISSTLYVPAKTNAGNYTINTTSNTTYTVGTLPTGVLNDMAIVSDATAPTYLGALVGGGAVVTPVWHNGTIWVSR